MVSELAWGTLGSPVGELSLACSPAGVARIRFGPPPAQPVRRRGSRPRAGACRDTPASASVPPGGVSAGPGWVSAGPDAARAQLAQACAQVAEFFGGQRRAFDVPVDWAATSPAQRQVLSALLASVGFGQTVTYGMLARRAGLADGGKVPPARVVGQIMGANPIPVIVPCHRVVAGDGLGGYSGGAGIEIKRWLLIFEGALPPTLDWDPAGPSINRQARAGQVPR